MYLHVYNSGNKIRVSNIIMNSSGIQERGHMNYTEGTSADALKYTTVITISTVSNL